MKPIEFRERPKKPKFKDLTGKKFGKLTVIGLNPKFANYPQQFLCSCKCGGTHSVPSYGLTKGKITRCPKCTANSRKKVDDLTIIEAHSRLKSIWKIADDVGLCGQTVHDRLTKLGIFTDKKYFTEDEMFFLREHYLNYVLDGKLNELAKKMGRHKSLICRQAAKIGLTDLSRPKKLLANYKNTMTQTTRDKRSNKSPMKGKKHTPETIEKISKSGFEQQAKINADPDRRAEITKKIIETKHERGNLVNERQKQTWKAGWREIGGKRKYFRSRWEANYARYLEFLKTSNQIKDWQHEAKVFWFDGIKRGCMSFLPDFQITELNDSLAYHEVKGWMDDRSKTKIRRMAIYHPDVPLTIIDAKWFKNNNKSLMLSIYGWET